MMLSVFAFLLRTKTTERLHAADISNGHVWQTCFADRCKRVRQDRHEDLPSLMNDSTS